MKRLAYLISRYPAVSHTFIQREIQALRSGGIEIFTASINPPDIDQSQASELDQAETDQTFYVKQAGFFQICKAFADLLFKSPGKCLKGISFAVNHSGKGMLYGIYYYFEAILVGKWMTEKKVSHLHVHFANPASTVAMIMTQIYPHTFSMTIHGPDEFYDATLNCLAEKIASASLICCISFYTQSQLMRLSDPRHWNKFKIIPLGIDPQIYSPKTFVDGPVPFQILSVGRLNPNKGHAILIQAFQQLIKEGYPVRLKIVGGGPERHSLKELIRQLDLEKFVDLTGPLSQEQTLIAYREADLFVLASFAEGVPVALMEAMSMEIPCIASGINGIPELIQNGSNGLLTVPSDIDGLARSMKTMIEKGNLRKELAQRGRKTVIEKYDLSKNIQSLVNLFNKDLDNEVVS